jgi:tetratricopeptide (TPR) repeat protein
MAVEAGIGRLLTDAERKLWPAGGALRSGFLIDARWALTAWHCVRDVGGEQARLWLRLQPLDSAVRFVEVPVRYAAHDVELDVALLAVDGGPDDLADVVLPLGSHVRAGQAVRVGGFPERNAAPHAIVFNGFVESAEARIGKHPAVRVHVPAFGARYPETPAGMSGGPLLCENAELRDEVVGVVVSYPRFGDDRGATGGGVVCRRLAEVCDRFPEVAALSRTVVVAASAELAEAQTEVAEVTMTFTESELVVEAGGRRVTSPHGGVNGELAWAVEGLRRARAGLGPLRRSAAVVEGGGSVQAASGEVARVVSERFLAGDAGALLGEALTAARRAHRPVLVGLRLPAEVGSVLAQLPWESARPPGSPWPLGLDPQVRMFRQVTAARRAARAGPLRVLVAIAAPLTGGGQVLDYEQELRNVVAAVRRARSGSAQVRVVQFATTAEIHTALRDFPAHVLHLSGHGLPGRLELEDDTGGARLVSPDELVDEAIPPDRMPLVFSLAACHTGRCGAAGDPSFAAGLVARGAAAVIATETAVTDVYATLLFAEVYAQLADDPGADVVAAVAQARVAVQRRLAAGDDRERFLAALQEWATVTVSAAAGRVPVVDPQLPATPVAEPLVAGVLRRETGAVVGRRREQRQWPAQLLTGRSPGLVIHGLGGVGKTTLADELVARVLDREPDRLVAVVTGQQTGTQLLDQLTTQLAAQLEHRSPSTLLWQALTDAARTSDLLPDRLAVLQDQIVPTLPILLVLDNFEDNLTDAATPDSALADDTLATVLAALLTRPGRARLLLTCRYRFQLPGRAHRLLTFHQLGPLSLAETLKLIWSLPALDRLPVTDLEQVWRAVGGHPRSLEYLDALLSDGTARHTDVTTRLTDAVERRLRTDTGGRPVIDADIDNYLHTHSTLDTALAEVATLAADDVLLDQLLGILDRTPHATRLLLGAAVYRHPVERNALAFQLGDPDPAVDPIAHYPTIDQTITDLLTAAGVDPAADKIDLEQLPACTRDAVRQALQQRRPRLAIRLDVDPDHIIGLCTLTSLLTTIDTTPDSGYVVHRWTATALEDRARHRGHTDQLIDAHLRAAEYWQWRVRYWPQTPHHDAADLTEAQHHLQTAADLGHQPGHADLATITRRLVIALRALGRRQDAAAQADLLHRLRQQQHAATATDTSLAALALHGVTLADTGQRHDAYTATAEATTLYRRLAVANPAAFEPNLTASLNNLGAMLSGLGRRGEALTVTSEAVEVYRRLAVANPAAFEPNLAMSLNNLGNMLSELGRWGEALTVTSEAVEVYRRLAVANPAAFEPDLATSLNNLGIRLSELGRPDEALTAIREAVEVRRRLAVANPAAFEPNLAASLNNLGAMLSELGRRDEALTATTEAVEIYQRKSAETPAVFASALHRSLTTLTDLLTGLGRNDEAQDIRNQIDGLQR